MSNNKIAAEKVDINTLFSNFWFSIPEYQRSYVWESDNINDLLDDLWFAFENRSDSEYFLGSLVLKKTAEKNFDEYEVLDGQQRLTTLLVLMAVLRDITENEDLKSTCQERIFQKENKFKGIPQRIRLIYKIRDNVGKYIDDHILDKEGTKNDKISAYIESKNVSISHMSNAILTMRKFFDAKNSDDRDNFGAYLGLKPIFIYVSTESREDAFRMFTILNNRGIPLTNADILKSVNIGEIENEKERDNYAIKWEQIEGDFGDDFDRFLSFIRTILVKEKARLNLLDEYEENIYKKKLLEKGKNTIDYLSNIKLNYDIVIRLNGGMNFENEYKNLLTIMDIGMPSEDWIPPLLAFYNKFSNSDLLAFLKNLEYKFSSDWILQFTPTQRIENMNNIIKKIDKSSTSSEIMQDLSLFKVDGTQLKNTLEGNIYGRRFARYILLKYEFLQGDNTAHFSNFKSISVEHILPQNPSKESHWVSVFSEEDRKKWTHKLANLLLISKKKNSKLSNLDFSEKKKRYLKGRIDVFPSSKIFITYEKWNTDILEKRQKEIIGKLVVCPGKMGKMGVGPTKIF